MKIRKAEDINFENQTILVQKVTEILVENAKEYYEEIICHRPIPDTRDGLTEVQRRILWSLYLKRWNSSKPHIKSARVIGDVIGRTHPHGDSSVYDTSSNMTQPWKNQIRLIDWHGNMGSISGKKAAAQRYTEMRSSKESEELMFKNLGDNCVDFVPNYDNLEEEPLYLPAKLPMYLINGAFGIAAGYAVSVPPHNPVEVIKETIARIQDPTHDIELMPDFPTGGTIINSDAVKEAYKTGEGKVVIRAKIEKDEKGKKLIITEIPYLKTLSSIMTSIVDSTKERDDPKVKGKKLPPLITSIKNIKDETENNEPYVIIEAKRDADLDVLMAQLYEVTSCQFTLPMKLLGTIDRNFIIYDNVNEVVDEWINFRKVTIQRIKMEMIKKHKLRIHILEGLIKTLAHIDEIIPKIKKSKSKKDTIEMLMKTYKLSEVQANNVAEYKLYRLATLEIEKLDVERQELFEIIEKELAYFKNKNLLNELMVSELEELLKSFKGCKRKTELLNISYKSEEEKVNAIPDEDYLMLCTHNGYVKKLQLPKSQNRGGKGISVGSLKEDDYVINSTVLNSRDSIFIFTEEGNVYKFKVYELPINKTNNLGTNIKSIINEETIVSMIPIKDSEIEDENKYIMSATEFNRIKLIKLSEFKNVRNNGILFTRLETINDLQDRVISVEKIEKGVHDSIIALNNLGNAIRVKIEDIPVSLRPAYGSQLFETKLVKDGGCVTSVTLVDETKTHYFLITQNGLGKRMLLNEFECQKRVTKGKMACKLKDDDCAIKLLPVNEEDNIIIISSEALISVPSEKISVTKRPTYGCTVKKVEGDEYIIDCVTE